MTGAVGMPSRNISRYHTLLLYCIAVLKAANALAISRAVLLTTTENLANVLAVCLARLFSSFNQSLLRDVVVAISIVVAKAPYCHL